MDLPELVKLLRCPETHQPLRLAEGTLLEELNKQVASGSLRNRAGNAVSSRFDGGLVREDGKVLYPIRGKLPIMLIDEAVDLAEPALPRL
jgi:uncharacterized protein YbaR (Trm112 family)